MKTRLDSTSSPPLAGIRVIDTSDEFGAYAGRLLASLGADVIRVQLAGTSDRPPLAPITHADGETVSFFDEFVEAGKRSVVVDPGSDHGRRAWEELVGSADVVLTAGTVLPIPDDVVQVSVTPFGLGQGPEWEPVDDLIVLGAGGLLHLGGYGDTGPVAAYGGQSLFAAGIFGAVAALVGLLERDRNGTAISADVSAQESVAQGLEDSVPAYALTGTIRRALGDDSREAGSGIYRCADGYVSMLAGRLGTAVAWASLVGWLQEGEPEAAALGEPAWSDFSHRQTPEANAEFRRIFEAFAASRTKQELYHEAQARHIALSPVNDIDALVDDDQLVARGFFHRFDDGRLGPGIVTPGPPFRLSATPLLSLGRAPLPGEDTEVVLSELGLSEVEGGVR